MLQKEKLLEGLNTEQKQAVTHDAGPLLIVAGAGTGKTTVITRRIAYLIEQGVRPNEILAMAFGEKAAQEMEERVDTLLPLGYYDLQVSTFHSFCEQILREYGLEIGLPDFHVANEVRQWLLVRNNLDKFNLDYYRPLGNPSRFVSALISHFARAKDELISPEDYLGYAGNLKLDHDSGEGGLGPADQEARRTQEVANAYHVYQKILLDNNLLDFGDLINYTLELFAKRPKLLNIYRERFKYVLIDEFQDTNFAQYELIKLLAAPRNNLTVVGDDDQSIFKFRGASISNILHFQKDYPDAKFINLVENYRNRQNILDMAHKFISQNNPDRLEIKLGLPKKLNAQTTELGIIEHHCLADYTQEADFVALKIESLMAGNKSLTWNDFAILARSHDALDPFIKSMEERQIPYIYFANKGLFQKPIILDVIAYFKLLDNYHESTAFFRVLNFAVFDIKPESIVNLVHHAKKKSLSIFEAAKQAATLKIDQASVPGINKLLGFLEKHSQAARTRTAAQVYIQVISDLDFRKSLNTDNREGIMNGRYLDGFLRYIQDFQNGSADQSLNMFMQHMDFELDAGETGDLEADAESGPEAVKLMTVHAAKGLEFTYVFVVSLVDKRFPSIERREAIEIPPPLVKDILPVGDVHLEEERRLFYVAVTRAKNGLVLTRALDYGGRRTKKASRFLEELGISEQEKERPTGKVIFSKRKTDTAFSLPMPKLFSFSQISTFRKCPLEYKYRYILKLPMPGSAALSFGSTIHATLEKFLSLVKQQHGHQDLFGKPDESKAMPTLEQLLKIYEQTWIDDWYEDKGQMERYRKSGREILAKFHEFTKSHPPRPKYVEKNFRLGLCGSWILGKIDRADETPEGLLIIDYKTGREKTKISPVDKQQLLLYQWAAQEALNEKVAGLQYWYLSGNLETETFLGQDAELSALKEEFLETLKEIKDTVKDNDFFKVDQRRGSHNCQFQDLERHTL